MGGFGARPGPDYGARYAVAAHVERGRRATVSDKAPTDPERGERFAGVGQKASQRRRTSKAKAEKSRATLTPKDAFKQNGKITYDVFFLKDGRHFYVSRLDQQQVWNLPPGGIPVYPSCVVNVSVNGCKELDDAGFRSELESMVEVYDQIIAYMGKDGPETTGSSMLFETQRERGVNPLFSFKSSFNSVWDEGNLVFKSKAVGGMFTSERLIGRAELSKEELAPGGTFKVRLQLQAAPGAVVPAGFVEVVVKVGRPSNSFADEDLITDKVPEVANESEPAKEKPDEENEVWEARSVVSIFRQFDTDVSGTIDRVEFARVLGALCPDWDQHMLEDLFANADTDRDGMVEYAEFVDFLFFGAGIGRDQDPEAVNYIPEKGDMILVPDWLPSARLLIQEADEADDKAKHMFFFVTGAEHRYSSGVYGRCTITGNSAILEAVLLGSDVRPFVASSQTYEVLLGDELDGDVMGAAGGRSCSVPPSVQDGFLIPLCMPKMTFSRSKPTPSPRKSRGSWVAGSPLVIPLDLSGFNAERLVALFEQVDTDGSGRVDMKEFAAFVRQYIPKCSEYDIESLAAFADKDGTGDISYEELVGFLHENASVPSEELDAGMFEAADGETVFVGNYNPYGRLLLRSTGTFSYVSSIRHKFSEGVQGKCHMDAQQCALEAVHFGNRAVNVGEPTQVLTLESSPYQPHLKRYAGCLTAVHPQRLSQDWGWLRPPVQETVM